VLDQLILFTCKLISLTNCMKKKSELFTAKAVCTNFAGMYSPGVQPTLIDLDVGLNTLCGHYFEHNSAAKESRMMWE